MAWWSHSLGTTAEAHRSVYCSRATNERRGSIHPTLSATTRRRRTNETVGWIRNAVAPKGPPVFLAGVIGFLITVL